MSESSCLIVLNTDIAGIGIRVSMYILALGGPIAAVFTSSAQLFRSIERSLAVTGLALLLTSFISVGQGTFDLFHVLCILHLVGLCGFSLRPAPRDGKTNRVIQVATYGSYFLGLLGFSTFILYVFVTAPRFGANPECNQQIVYVIFGFNVPATNYEFRWLFIGYMIMCIVAFLIATIFGFVIISKKAVSDEGGIRHLRFVGDIAGRSYIIAMLELIIRRNNASVDGSNWSFGQILAMMMLIAPIIELVSLVTSKDSNEGDNKKMNPVTRDAFDSGGLFHKVICGMMLNFWRLMSVSDFVFLSILDLGFNAAAGAAAAATGAHVNGNPTTGEILRIGAWAAVIKSGILNYSMLTFIMSTSATNVIILFATTSFGSAFVVTLAVTQRVLHSTPDALLIGALAAGAPLTLGGAILVGNSPIVSSLPANAAWDALAGYTFARVAHNHGEPMSNGVKIRMFTHLERAGFDVCSYKAAAAAGAVFGVLIWVFKPPIKWANQPKKAET
ncbi:hypothetical protein FRB91_000283 [Serendipita sp. 411]|nr:hypothetical protein FRB91_000283 [Serendipita sp. 411]